MKPELPVVILSARGDVQTKLRGFELGATDYVAKPFSLDELLARIRVRLRGAPTFGDEHVLRGGNVVLDVARRQAGVGRADGRPLRPRVPAAPPSARARRRGPEQRAAARRGVGLRLRPGLERRRRLRAPAAAEARPGGCRSRRCGMRVIGWLRRNPLEAAWAVFAVANWVAMIAWPAGRRSRSTSSGSASRRLRRPRLVDADDVGSALGRDRRDRASASRRRLQRHPALGRALRGAAHVGDVPGDGLACAAATGRARQVQGVAEMRASLLERQERFLHDASHELRTPVTIARGHLELLRREQPDAPELEVALDELGRMERIVERLLLLAKSEQQGFAFEEIDLEAFLSDLFIRWSEVAPRAWRLDVDLAGTAARRPRGAAERPRRAARERGQVHGSRRRRRARGARRTAAAAS